ncbi:MAG: VWA domain-containing protein [Acidimicrobiia bacterium]|nr:VWA domain-containing protein [Acidimicrobiia bacterium]MDH5291289.1 VWA domain-containing protein [Acidimicrobiia bacterium]
MSDFNAEVFQNEFLPAGVGTVDAIVTVRSCGGGAAGAAAGQVDAVEIILIDTSGSMTEEGGRKWRAAQAATQAAIDTIRDGVHFAVVGGHSAAYMIYPHEGLAVADAASRAEAKTRVSMTQPQGGTAMGTWLQAGAYLAGLRPQAMAHAILLTDGKNQHEEPWVLDQSIAACVGRFQCDARGLGADWNIGELRKIASALLGTVDIIPQPDDMVEAFTELTQKAMGRQVGSVDLRLWTPKGSSIQFVKQVAPSLEDLTSMARNVDALTNDYPLGAWSGEEERDYHVRVTVPVGAVGDERLAARVTLRIDGVDQPAALVRAVWTDDEALSTRINREVAHYTGQAELADAIAEGLAARDAGDEARATMKLGRAVQLATATGNTDTVRLLAKVVDVDDAGNGTVRLKREVEKTDEMALDVRSTRTVRVNKG